MSRMERTVIAASLEYDRVTGDRALPQAQAEKGFRSRETSMRGMFSLRTEHLRLKTLKMMDEIRLRRKVSRLRQKVSEDATSATPRPGRGTGSNSENSNRPAKKPPICACQATPAPSTPIAIDPTPKTMLTPNQTPRNARTRGLRSARESGSTGHC